MADEIIVPELSVNVATGPSCYPNENGFSGISAEIVTSDNKVLEALLRQAMRDGRSITARCAMLDVVGIVFRETSASGESKFTVRVEDLHYRKPVSAPVIVEHKRRKHPPI